MNIIGKISGLVFVALLAACAQTNVAPDPVSPILRTDNGDPITRAALIQRLAAADVVIIGEVHDNLAHHQNQAWLVDRLAPRGLAAEMLPMAEEDLITQHLASGGAAGQIGPLVGWEKTGWPDWEMYRGVFEALPSGVWTITGGGLPRETVRAAVGSSAAEHAPDPALVPVLSTPLPADQQAEAEQEMIASHCGHLPESAAAGMVEGQRLRDASLAAAVIRATERSGGPVVLITGNGHARHNRGVPVYLAALAPALSVVSIGQLEEPADGAADGPYDYVWITERAEREDPCARFRKSS